MLYPWWICCHILKLGVQAGRNLVVWCVQQWEEFPGSSALCVSWAKQRVCKKKNVSQLHDQDSTIQLWIEYGGAFNKTCPTWNHNGFNAAQSVGGICFVENDSSLNMNKILIGGFLPGLAPSTPPQRLPLVFQVHKNISCPFSPSVPHQSSELNLHWCGVLALTW